MFVERQEFEVSLMILPLNYVAFFVLRRLVRVGFLDEEETLP